MQSCQLEYSFWEMAYTVEDWPVEMGAVNDELEHERSRHDSHLVSGMRRHLFRVVYTLDS